MKTTGKTLREKMTDNGWRFEVEGEFSVPEAFEVHIVNRTAMRSEGAVSGAIVRSQRGFVGFVHRVSASNLYYPAMPRMSSSRLRIRNRLKELEQGLEEVAARPRYEIQEAEYNGSDILGDAGKPFATERLVETKVFSRPVKQVWVAISSVNTVNDGARGVFHYWFTGHGGLDPTNRNRVNVFIGHHMTDLSQGSRANGGFVSF